MRSALAYPLLLAAAILCYVPAIGGGFILDDAVLVTDNVLVRSNVGLVQIWASHRAADYFPLTLTSFWIEWKLWGPHPLGYHAVNVALHATSVSLLYRLLARLEMPGAWLAALLFAVHPLGVPSVAWIAERKNALSLPLYLGSALLFVRAERTGGPRVHIDMGALATFALALLAKTTGVTVPLLYLWWRWRERQRTSGFGLRDVARLAPYFLASLACGLLTIWFQLYPLGEGGWAPALAPGLPGRLALAARAVWFYLAKIIAPVGLMSFYPAWEAPTASVANTLPALALVAAWVVLLAGRGRTAAPRRALGATMVLLLPVLGLVDMTYHRFSWVADHWVYLPMIPMMALGGFAASKGLDRLTGRARQVAVAGAAGVILLLAGQTVGRAHIYADEERLWRHLLAQDPSSWGGHSQLAFALTDRMRLAEAEEHARAALRLRPRHAALYVGLGHILAKEDHIEEAISLFQTALQMAPRYGKPLQNIVQIRVNQQRFAEAEQTCRQALARDAENAFAHAFLSRLLQRRGALDESMQHARAALALDPDDFNWHRLVGSVLASQGHGEEALEHFRRVMAVRPDPETQREIDAIEKRLGRRD